MKKIKYTDLILMLKNIGIKEGDSLLIHSNSDLFQNFDCGYSKRHECEFLLKALMECLGPEGSLFVPMFN